MADILLVEDQDSLCRVLRLTLEPNDLGPRPSVAGESEALQRVNLSGTLSDVAHRALRLVERRKIIRALEANSGNKIKEYALSDTR